MVQVAAPSPGWVVVVPVKRFADAKTRLGLPPAERAGLALAMAEDTVTAVLAATQVAGVVVVSDEPAVAALAGGRLRVTSDAPAAGLNAALRHGAALARGERPDVPLAALSSDLPALRPPELDAALTAAAGQPRALVADAAGTGTVLLTAAAGVPLEPRFGPGSRAAHRAAGVVDVTAALAPPGVPGLRLDVDTPADLAAARQLGVGPATLARLDGPAPPSTRQATVRTWTAGAGGTALLDDGTLVELGSRLRLAGGLRALRPGQRITLSDGYGDGDGTATLPTWPTADDAAG